MYKFLKSEHSFAKAQQNVNCNQMQRKVTWDYSRTNNLSIKRILTLIEKWTLSRQSMLPERSKIKEYSINYTVGVDGGSNVLIEF